MTFHFHSLSFLDPSTLPPRPILRNHSALPLPPHLHHPYPFSPVDISELWTKVVYTFILTRYTFTLHTQSQKKVLYIFKDLKHYHLDIIRGAIIASPPPPSQSKRRDGARDLKLKFTGGWNQGKMAKMPYFVLLILPIQMLSCCIYFACILLHFTKQKYILSDAGFTPPFNNIQVAPAMHIAYCTA